MSQREINIGLRTAYWHCSKFVCTYTVLGSGYNKYYRLMFENSTQEMEYVA
jgi:hypothetical protein